MRSPACAPAGAARPIQQSSATATPTTTLLTSRPMAATLDRAHTALVIFTQYYLDCLSHASYLIGDETSGRAVVVDPQRDVGGYLEDANEGGLTIEHIIETHVHADFLSGDRELTAKTGADIAYGEVAETDFP